MAFGFKLWTATGNPLFPLYNGIFRSPDWFAVSPTDQRFTAKSLADLVLFPFYWTDPKSKFTELAVQDLRAATLLTATAVGVVIFAVRRLLGKGVPEDLGPRRRLLLALALFLILSYFLWAKLFGIYR